MKEFNMALKKAGILAGIYAVGFIFCCGSMATFVGWTFIYAMFTKLVWDLLPIAQQSRRDETAVYMQLRDKQIAELNVAAVTIAADTRKRRKNAADSVADSAFGGGYVVIEGKKYRLVAADDEQS